MTLGLQRDIGTPQLIAISHTGFPLVYFGEFYFRLNTSGLRSHMTLYNLLWFQASPLRAVDVPPLPKVRHFTSVVPIERENLERSS